MSTTILDMEIAIIGGGPAGLTAALYATRAMRRTVLFEPMAVGGQIATTDRVENFPGFPEGLSGADLALRMIDQAKRFGLEHRAQRVETIRVHETGFALETPQGQYTAGAVIAAMGATHRLLGLPRERDLLQGRGLSVCATCDGAFHRDEPVLVVGGGDAAIDGALYLARMCSRVTVIHRRDRLRASQILQERAFAEPHIHFLWDTEVIGLLGEEILTGVRIQSVKTGEEHKVEGSALFVFIGHTPNTSLLRDLVDLDDGEHVIADPTTLTTRTPGLFAAGDLRAGAMRQAITAAGDGCNAAMQADIFLTRR